MSPDLPWVMVWGHCLVRRLHANLEQGFHPQACSDFAPDCTAHVRLFNCGGCNVPKLWSYDLHVVSRSFPDIVIIEIATNDLSTENPSLVAFSIEVLVRFLHDRFSVKVICVFINKLRG